MITELFERYLNDEVIKKLTDREFHDLKEEIIKILKQWNSKTHLTNEKYVFKLIDFFLKKFNITEDINKKIFYAEYTKYCNLLFYRVLCEITLPFKDELDHLYKKLIRTTDYEWKDAISLYWWELFLNTDQSATLVEGIVRKTRKTIEKNDLKSLLTKTIPSAIAFSEDVGLKKIKGIHSIDDQIILFSLFSDTKLKDREIKKGHLKNREIKKSLLKNRPSNLVYFHKLLVGNGLLLREFFSVFFEKNKKWEKAYEVFINSHLYGFWLGKSVAEEPNLLKKTLKSFWEKDHISFFAYAVPLIESTIEQFYKSNFEIKPNPCFGDDLSIKFISALRTFELCLERIVKNNNEEKILNKELHESNKKWIINKKLKKDFLFIFELLFSGYKGFNIRNSWAHGDFINDRFASDIYFYHMFALVCLLLTLS